MSIFPKVTGKRLIKALLRFGLEKKKKQNGSHVFIYDPKDLTKSTTIPNSIFDLKPGTLNDIKKQLKLPDEKFLEILRNC